MTTAITVSNEICIPRTREGLVVKTKLRKALDIAYATSFKTLLDNVLFDDPEKQKAFEFEKHKYEGKWTISSKLVILFIENYYGSNNIVIIQDNNSIKVVFKDSSVS